MAIDASFWVAISFIIFLGALIYLKIPQKINAVLNKLISDIKNEPDESEKLRSEAKILLDNAQTKLDTAEKINKDIVIMHPGPINRGVELNSDVADSNNSIILDQVENGVAIRMAVMYLLSLNKV